MPGNKQVERIVPKETGVKPLTAPAKFKNADVQNTLMQKSMMKAQEGEGVAYVLIDEDFSRMTGPTDGSPDMSNNIASFSDENVGPYIDPTLTTDATWSGDKIYSANGTVVLAGDGFMTPSVLNTPLGDYSGKITMTFRAKPVQENGNNVYLSIFALYNDIFNSTESTVRNGHNMDVNLYQSDKNWTEITVTFENHSANNDGFIQISCPGKVIIDDIKITTEPTFIANPAMNETIFSDDGFILSWQPVRRAFNYYLYLYKLTPFENSTFNENFDNVSADGTGLPEGWTFNQKGDKVSPNGGSNGSKGVILGVNDTIVTANKNGLLETATAWFRSFYSEGYDINKDENGSILIEGFNGTRWVDLAAYYLNSFHESMQPGEVNISEEATAYGQTFTGKYYMLRFSIRDCSDPGAYAVLDNVNLTIDGAGELKLVETYDGYEYAFVEVGEPGTGADGTSFEVKFNYNEDDRYPYKNLSPDADYFFVLQSHYLYIQSDAPMLPVIGVLTPQVMPATDISETGSYKANWRPVTRATSYIVNNYGVTRLTKDTRDFVVMNESFSKASSSAAGAENAENLSNTTTTTLDELTDNPGWTGRMNTVAQGMIGCEASTSAFIATPTLSLGSANVAYVTIKVYGNAGDILELTTTDGDTYTHEFASNMTAEEATFVIEDCTENETFTFKSEGGLAWAIESFIVTQNLDMGDVVYTYLSTREVEAPSTSVVFDGLAGTGFTIFAYNVKSVADRSGTVATSLPSDYAEVNISNITTNVFPTDIHTAGCTDAVEQEHYDLSGRRVSKEAKGIQIVKMSDGSVKKVIVK